MLSQHERLMSLEADRTEPLRKENAVFRYSPAMLAVLALVGSVSMAAEIKDIHWKLGPDFPVLRKGGGFGAIRGKVISAGGMEQPWSEAKTAYMLDLANPTKWAKLPDRPIGRCYVQAGVVGDSLYVVGGRLQGRTRADGHKLTFKDGGWTWSKIPDLNQPRGWAPIVPSGSRLYAVGGFAAENWGKRIGHTLNSIEMMDTADPKPAWREVAQIPGRSRGWLSAAAVHGKLYIFGGIEMIWKGRSDMRRQPLDEVKVYDPATKTWDTLPPLPFTLGGTDCVVYRDRWVLIFGGSHFKYTPELRKRKEAIQGHESYYNPFVLVYDTQKPGCRVLPTPMPYPTNDIRAALVGDTVITFAGENIQKETSNTTRWVRIGKLIF